MCVLTLLKPGEVELYEFLDSNDNNPNFGMALEEAIEQHLITEEEAKRILDSAAADLQWNRMLADAGRNKKLQDFIKSNRWMRRQKFVDFAAIEELEQKRHLEELEKKERDLQDAVRHLILIFGFCLSIFSRIRSWSSSWMKLKRDCVS
jgi:hypothetical protein